MNSFLKIVADDLYNKLQGDFRDTTIVFPNKRASLFFDQYLWENAKGKTLWAPQYTTLGDLFASLSPYTLGDPVTLVVKLWDIYAKKMRPTKTIDQLYTLVETILSDFQDIDNNLVDPTRLFVNIADLKEMTDFSFLEAEQRKALEQFFGRFFDPHTHNADTHLKQQFKTLWNQLADIYHDYRHSLLHPSDSQKVLYDGLLKRLVIEDLYSSNAETQARTLDKLTSQTYAVVGFNVLNKTERELFRALRLHRQAMFYWDYDVTYTTSASTSLQSKYEAGQFIRENIAFLGDELPKDFRFDNMRKPKQIQIVQAPTDNAQARYVRQWQEEHPTDNPSATHAAIVLCNENLLLPVLHSVNTDSQPVNITMGYPFVHTATYTFVRALVELQLNGRTRANTWRYSYVASLLRHPFLHQIAAQQCDQILEQLTQSHTFSVSPDTFSSNPHLALIFTPVAPHQLPQHLAQILALVPRQQADKEEGGEAPSGTFDLNTLLNRESLYLAYTTINHIAILQATHPALTHSPHTPVRLLLQCLQNATIPFHGQPAQGLQVMGLLETRNLDFTHLLILSANEGKIPRNPQRPSLIPYTLRAVHRLTTIERQISLHAYYYYRLIQRARTITILYNNSTADNAGGQPSRFLLQTLTEADQLLAPTTSITHRTLVPSSQVTPCTNGVSIKKTPDVMEKLITHFTPPATLSPTALNTYIQCPLRFYFKYVADLRPLRPIDDDIDSATFGNILHQTMHQLLLPFLHQPVTAQQLRDIAFDQSLLYARIDEAIAMQLRHENTITPLNGKQHIRRHILHTLIRRILLADADTAQQLQDQNGYLQIQSLEQNYSATINLLTAPIPITLGGIIDRLDILHTPNQSFLRIVDYKTSQKPHTANDIAQLFDSAHAHHTYHINQILLYADILTQQPTDRSLSIVPALVYPFALPMRTATGMISIPHLSATETSPLDFMPQNAIVDYERQCGEQYHAHLQQVLQDIFTPHQPTLSNQANGAFHPIPNPQHCSHCEYLSLCQPKPQQCP